MKIIITLSALRGRDVYAREIVEALRWLLRCFRHGDTGIGDFTIEVADPPPFDAPTPPEPPFVLPEPR